jgi:hypothetical protein
MYIEKRMSDGKIKLYLAHSYRDGKRVRKMRIYLGLDLSGKQLEEKKKEAEKEIKRRIKALRIIRDPYHTVISPAELQELKTILSKGKVRMMHLSEGDWLRFTEIFTYDTNAIEGSTVTEKEVEGILERNKWPDRSKDEISETYGVADAVTYIRKTKDHISLDLIKELHRIVFRNSKGFAGRFRKKGEEVVILDGRGSVVHRGAPSTHVTSLLRELVSCGPQPIREYPSFRRW